MHGLYSSSVACQVQSERNRSDKTHSFATSCWKELQCIHESHTITSLAPASGDKFTGRRKRSDEVKFLPHCNSHVQGHSTTCVAQESLSGERAPSHTKRMVQPRGHREGVQEPISVQVFEVPEMDSVKVETSPQTLFVAASVLLVRSEETN